MPASFVYREDCAAHGVRRDAHNVLRRDTALFHRAFHRRNQARPPLIGVLLGPARTRVLQRISPSAKDERRPFGVEDADPRSPRSEVDAKEVRTVGPYYAPLSRLAYRGGPLPHPPSRTHPTDREGRVDLSSPGCSRAGSLPA